MTPPFKSEPKGIPRVSFPAIHSFASPLCIFLEVIRDGAPVLSRTFSPAGNIYAASGGLECLWAQVTLGQVLKC
jgi:hypothetical protein